MIPARISLSAAAPAFRPDPARVHRISLAWWDPSETEGQREPILVASITSVARTVVVVWPTDARGLLDPARLRAGEVEVVPWDLDGRLVEQIRDLARYWPLDRHDLQVRASGLAPFQESLRLADLGIGLEHRIEAAIARLVL